MVSSLAASTVSLRRIAYEPGAVLARHTHERPYFCLVLAGSYRGTYWRSTQVASAGGVAYRAAEEPHVVECCTDSRLRAPGPTEPPSGATFGPSLDPLLAFT